MPTPATRRRTIERRELVADLLEGGVVARTGSFGMTDGSPPTPSEFRRAGGDLTSGKKLSMGGVAGSVLGDRREGISSGVGSKAGGV